MKHLALLAVGIILTAFILMAGRLNPTACQPSFVSDPAAMEASAPPFVCFAPGTSPEYMAEWEARIRGNRNLDYYYLGRWSQTATDPSTNPEGKPITLTYSFVPDGLSCDGYPSELFARMNALFGSPDVWQAKFASVFERWGYVCGIRYVQVADDGASWSNSPGVLGQRGDVRIGARPMDGASGVLAYNYQPNNGNMLLDADEPWNAPGQNYIFLRNIVAHEHGHGWGLAHCCPINNTKLLEPYYSNSFDGPQHDDIRGAHQYYGDRYEDNDNSGTASRLGTIPHDTTFSPLSLDHIGDVDYYKFAIPAGQGFTLTLVPIGGTYLQGPQNQDGSCTAGTPVNSLLNADPELWLYNASGGNLLAASTLAPIGEPEQIYHYPVAAAGDSFMIRVVGTGDGIAQLYDLQFDLFNLNDPYMTVAPLLFDTVGMGQTKTMVTGVINPSSTPINIYSFSIGEPFSVSPNTPQSIAAYDTLDLVVNFQSFVIGDFTSVLSIAHSGPGGILTCEVSATAVTSWLQIVLSPIVNFGDVPLGTIDSARSPVRAQGNIPLTIQGISVNAPFSIELSLPLVLQPTQSVFLYPRFTPTGLGVSEGDLIIYHTGTTSPDTLHLIGNCVPDAAVDLPGVLPTEFRVHSNYPNPFNAITRIAFDLPRASRVALSVYDINGRLEREIAVGAMQAGSQSLVFDASGLSSGVYLYRITTPEYSGIGKMMLLK